MKAIVSKTVTFDAAHYLPNYPGKCSALHGHRWVVRLAVKGEVNEETGMVVDFTLLSKFLKEYVVEKYDHSSLNNYLDNPTAENIALTIVTDWTTHQLSNPLPVKLVYVRVWESEDSFTEVYDD